MPVDDAIEAARAMLKERLAKPADDAAESKRRRLERALESLRKQHQWGDIGGDEYRTERREIEAALATLPARSTDTLVAFDEARARLLSMPEAITAASPERRAEIVGLLVERVTATRTTGMTGLEWTAPAAPFFRRVLSERAVRRLALTTRSLRRPAGLLRRLTGATPATSSRGGAR